MMIVTSIMIIIIIVRKRNIVRFLLFHYKWDIRGLLGEF